jgi:hypothetical protein
MPLITSVTPATWQELEELAAAILALLAGYARTGLRELRGVNPNTRGKADGAFVRELDAPMPPVRPDDLP